MFPRRLIPLTLALAVVAMGCGSGPEQIRAVSDGMDCTEVAAILEEATARGQRFVAGQETDTVLAGDLVFALSGAEERPECIDETTRSRAAGLRATLSGIGG